MRQNCLVLPSWQCEHKWTQDRTLLSCLQLCSHHQLNKTRQFCRVSNCVHTANADPSKLGQGETKLSCQWCENNWTPDKAVFSRRVGGVNKPLGTVGQESVIAQYSPKYAAIDCVTSSTVSEPIRESGHHVRSLTVP